MEILYKKILKPILFRFDPEKVHDLFISIGDFCGRFWLTRKMIDIAYGYHGRDISKIVDGITYRTPFLLSAGFDYNGRLTSILSHIGFGGEEIGSVTARPCAGNSVPRLIRLPKSESILVNKGLKNDGVDKIIERLKTITKNQLPKTNNQLPTPSHQPLVLGISIAKTNDAQCVSVEEGIEDYLYSFRRLNEENIGDYYTINISCPNVFGGESFTDPVLLEQLLTKIREVSCQKPIYVKMPINIPWDQFDELLKIIDKAGIHGVVIGNLNKDYDSLLVREEAPREYRGGLSGKPCASLSTDLIRKTRTSYGKRFTIIGVGGVMSPETAREKFEAGADLVQLITGLIFEGPGLIRRLCVAKDLRCKDSTI